MRKRIGAIALLMATAACSGGAKPDIVGIRPLNDQTSGTSQDALARAELLFSRGEHALALDAYRRAVRADPKDARALNGVAISYAAMGRHDLARQFFEMALARAPQDGRIYRNFARSLRAQGLDREADVLLAQADPAAVRSVTMRPTLAQIAASGDVQMAAAQSRGPELERMSLGEVQLRTSVADNGALGRRGPQLNTAIVTVSDRGGLAPAPATELTRALNAPIVSVDEKPRLAAQEEKPKAVSGKASAAMVDEEAMDGLFQRLWREWRGNSRG